MDFNQQFTTASPQETARLGEELGNYLVKSVESRALVCLYGELGSGKTTFVQGFAKTFGITSRLLSPSFIIVRRYPIPQSPGFLYHIDLYRVESENELPGLGLSEILADLDSVVLVEWAEKMGNLLPNERIDVRFITLENGSHQISIQRMN
ncbi:tRNA (adenosine(37)-N6)-threonylcarbamoyltransferase complex ATPase subunit type 1 TsaE [Candidatus Gottesmanbacteria bacterium]|nr:tRNA (adenosine(37)-N6)-threonylcarbamoyltransferase complex ATPase subunit type 1 TsaE [Candidatus Gottesmanbacteria bacterium]